MNSGANTLKGHSKGTSEKLEAKASGGQASSHWQTCFQRNATFPDFKAASSVSTGTFSTLLARFRSSICLRSVSGQPPLTVAIGIAMVSLRANCVLAPENLVPPDGLDDAWPAVAIVGFEAGGGACGTGATGLKIGPAMSSGTGDGAGACAGAAIISFFSSDGGAAGLARDCGWLSNKFAITFRGI